MINNMDAKKFKALFAAVEKGSLTAAATDLGYTQSGLTHMMNSLETELGLNLLVRNKNGVQFSPAGKELLPQMQALLDAAAALEEQAEKLRQRRFSTIRLGAYASVARQWLPLVLAEFRRISPDTEVTISVDSITGNYNGIKNDRLDCAIVSYQETLAQGLHWIPLRSDELVAVLPAGYKVVDSGFPVSEFSGTEFLMPSSDFDMDINPVFHTQNGKILPKIRYTNLDDASIVSMVEHGLGVSILSELVMRDMRNDVLTAPLDPPAFRQLGIIVNEHRLSDRIVRNFLSCIQQYIGDMY